MDFVKRTVLVFGTNLSGKSTVLNSLTQTTVFTFSSSLQTFANKLPNGDCITYVEIPDISLIVNSLDKSSKDIIKKLYDAISSGVSALIFCYPITHVRCDSDKQRVMKFISTIFKSRLPRLFLAFTFCSMLNKEALIKAKKETAAQVISFFNEVFNEQNIYVTYLDTNGINLLRNDIMNIKEVVKDLETLENLNMYIENERKESCEMLIQFADIMEEEKKITKKFESRKIVKDGNSKKTKESKRVTKKGKKENTKSVKSSKKIAKSNTLKKSHKKNSQENNIEITSARDIKHINIEMNDIPEDSMINKPNSTGEIQTKAELIKKHNNK